MYFYYYKYMPCTILDILKQEYYFSILLKGAFSLYPLVSPALIWKHISSERELGSCVRDQYGPKWSLWDPKSSILLFDIDSSLFMSLLQNQLMFFLFFWSYFFRFGLWGQKRIEWNCVLPSSTCLPWHFVTQNWTLQFFHSLHISTVFIGSSIGVSV